MGEDGERSAFNEGALQMQRIDDREAITATVMLRKMVSTDSQAFNKCVLREDCSLVCIRGSNVMNG